MGGSGGRVGSDAHPKRINEDERVPSYHSTSRDPWAWRSSRKRGNATNYPSCSIKQTRRRMSDKAISLLPSRDASSLIPSWHATGYVDLVQPGVREKRWCTLHKHNDL